MTPTVGPQLDLPRLALSLLTCSMLALTQAACGGGHDHDGHENHAAHDTHDDHADHGAHDTHDDHADHGAHDTHDGHAGHAGHDTSADELGRRLYGMEHQMPPELYAELRANIPLYAPMTDAEIDLSMEQMGPEYSWYISPAGLRGEQGVLLLSHGFRERGDMVFRDSVQAYANIFPTALAPGMAMMMSDHIRLAIEDLRSAGVRTLVVVPVLGTSYNELMRQWEYVLGLRDKAEFATVGQVDTEGLQLVVTSAANDDPMIAEILLDHALEISENPAREFILVVAHGASGPDSAADNEQELRILNNLARYVVEDGRFAGGSAVLLQDDAPAEIRARNVEAARKIVSDANRAGQRVLVITNLIGARTIQAKIRQDLQDLDYRLNAKGLTQHPRFTEWIGEAIRKGFETAAEKRSAAIAD